jgi:hypothetical protein
MADGSKTICHFINIYIMLSSKLSIFIVFITITTHCYSQNMVFNGSMEQLISCPTSMGQIDSALYWSHATDVPSVDLYCTCSNAFSPPYPAFNFQHPRTGGNYVGFQAFATYLLWPNLNLYKEYPKVQLKQQLTPNKEYNIRCYISNSGHFAYNSNGVTGDSLGFLFTSNDTVFNVDPYMNNIENPLPQAYDTSGFYVDTLNWIEIKSSFYAQGNEEYLIIGDFKRYDLIQNYYIWQYNLSTQNCGAYYYIDDVAIWPADTIPPPADAGSDTTICRGGKARLGTHSYGDYIYEWWPSATLSNDSGGIVWASPLATTTYYLQATDDIYTKTLDSITVYVNNCGQNDTTVCVEDQFQMGSTNNPFWNYQWSPANWLSSDTVGMPLCNPLQNTIYQLLITNQSGDTIAMDSTHIFVGACFNASAGKDSLICKNDSLQIGMQHHNFLTYAWSPHFMISDTTIGNPIVWNDTNTTYYLKLTDTLGRITYDSVLVGVHICIGIDDLENNPIKLSVYPNPAEDMLGFEFSEMLNSINIRVFDILGKEVISKEFSHKRKIDIDISSLSSGIYNYEVGKYFKGKFIKN